LKLLDFPARNFDKLRYGDTDRQGHVNNAVFATLFETGRVGVFHEGEAPLVMKGFSFVIARIVIDYRAELFWPGRVEIGTGVKKVGNSSDVLAGAVSGGETGGGGGECGGAGGWGDEAAGGVGGGGAGAVGGVGDGGGG